ncbi:unnamed protein product, partial [Leptidea sinapis]
KSHLGLKCVNIHSQRQIISVELIDIKHLMDYINEAKDLFPSVAEAIKIDSVRHVLRDVSQILYFVARPMM